MGITDPFNSSQDAQTCGYTHDDLGRIASDTCAGGVGWAQNFSYDAFGNLNKSGSSIFNAQYSAATNRIATVGSTAASYDANGNVLSDTVQSYAWDADGHPISIGNVGSASVGAAYDALGDVIEQNRSGSFTQVVYAPDGTKLALMSGTGTMVKAFVPLTGGATAVYTPSVTTGPTYYRHSDWLGSSRLTSTPSRTVYSDAAYAPFGETYAQSGTADASFTGMNQDTVATVDDFPAREYGSLSGRWASPDPLGVGAVDPTDLQSWNRYAYVRNSPLTLRDPMGTDYYCFWGEYSTGPSDSPPQGDIPEDYCEYNGGTVIYGDPSDGGGGGDSNPSVPGTTVTVSADAPYTQTIEIDPSPFVDPGSPDQGGGSGGGGGGAQAPYDALKDRLQNIFKNNPDCADLFGGLQKANKLLNSMTIIVVTPSASPFTSNNDVFAWNTIQQSNAGNPADPYWAMTVWNFSEPGVGWNGKGFRTYVGAKFAGGSPDAQASLLLHEIAHPLTGYTSKFGNGVMEGPNSPYSPANLQKECVN